MKRLTAIGLALGIGLFCVCAAYGQDKEKAEPTKTPAAEPAKTPAAEPVKPSAAEPARPQPAEPAKPSVPAAEKPNVFGVEVDPEIVSLTVDDQGKPRTLKGLHVRRVLPGTVAEQAGLQLDDVIVKINNHDITSFYEVVAALVETPSNRKGTVEYIRKSRLASGEFTPSGEFESKDFNLIYLVWARESRYAKRLDICGLVSNSTETKTGVCSTFAVCGPLLFDYHKVGEAETITTLFFVKIPWGAQGPVTF
jgi:membrane-associated protease RseP (regulator of RpoE activity)